MCVFSILSSLFYNLPFRGISSLLLNLFLDIVFLGAIVNGIVFLILFVLFNVGL